MSTELAEHLDSQPFPGISLLFILLFFAPLVLRRRAVLCVKRAGLTSAPR